MTAQYDIVELWSLLQFFFLIAIRTHPTVPHLTAKRQMLTKSRLECKGDALDFRMYQMSLLRNDRKTIVAVPSGLQMNDAAVLFNIVSLAYVAGTHEKEYTNRACEGKFKHDEDLVSLLP
ncbi:hypothetical protein CCR75_002454 [Bremia lactucae]|uniref:Uncharacterized protein n=1 Tax=Bremia lactucae TaxID=4779 RepID=A0A976ICL9_BRELC|nr:hypothetical protein CCR75_002454 [Bremia lactucae]